ncbi:MAG: RNA pseudouridine synthase [bacterium]|nr:RNA pseudouridine synthase [bacterium]
MDISKLIICEKSGVLFLNKPAPIVVHPCFGENDNTLIQFLRQYLPEGTHPRLLNRLDRWTSGCIAVSLNIDSHRVFAKLIESRMVRKVYHAVVRGVCDFESVEKRAPLKEHSYFKDNCKKDLLKDALTYFKVIERYRKFSLVRAEPVTGRTHQIRVHLSLLGHPVMGDPVYGGGIREWKDGYCLHAVELCFPGNSLTEAFSVKAPYDKRFEKAISLASSI